MAEPERSIALYQTPEGVIALDPKYGRRELTINKSADGLVMIKIMSDDPKTGNPRKFYQTIMIDADMAQHCSSRLWELAKE